ncbi:hypothetical protein [Martelella sp. HB161492]|uniref:hypothetical protein n=1 Tax=Martelella sp. HB161492 TaxID=2720726 RepID=UPI001590F535|nr:hypothetical protein [Martelella sp. HB161492]
MNNIPSGAAGAHQIVRPSSTIAPPAIFSAINRNAGQGLESGDADLAARDATLSSCFGRAPAAAARADSAMLSSRTGSVGSFDGTSAPSSLFKAGADGVTDGVLERSPERCTREAPSVNLGNVLSLDHVWPDLKRGQNIVSADHGNLEVREGGDIALRFGKNLSWPKALLKGIRKDLLSVQSEIVIDKSQLAVDFKKLWLGPGSTLVAQVSDKDRPQDLYNIQIDLKLEPGEQKADFVPGNHAKLQEGQGAVPFKIRLDFRPCDEALRFVDPMKIPAKNGDEEGLLYVRPGSNQVVFRSNSSGQETEIESKGKTKIVGLRRFGENVEILREGRASVYLKADGLEADHIYDKSRRLGSHIYAPGARNVNDRSKTYSTRTAFSFKRDIVRKGAGDGVHKSDTRAEIWTAVQGVAKTVALTAVGTGFQKIGVNGGVTAAFKAGASNLDGLSSGAVGVLSNTSDYQRVVNKGNDAKRNIEENYSQLKGLLRDPDSALDRVIQCKNNNRSKSIKEIESMNIVNALRLVEKNNGVMEAPAENIQFGKKVDKENNKILPVIALRCRETEESIHEILARHDFSDDDRRNLRLLRTRLYRFRKDIARVQSNEESVSDLNVRKLAAAVISAKVLVSSLARDRSSGKASELYDATQRGFDSWSEKISELVEPGELYAQLDSASSVAMHRQMAAERDATNRILNTGPNVLSNRLLERAAVEGSSSFIDAVQKLLPQSGSSISFSSGRSMEWKCAAGYGVGNFAVSASFSRSKVGGSTIEVENVGGDVFQIRVRAKSKQALGAEANVKVLFGNALALPSVSSSVVNAETGLALGGVAGWTKETQDELVFYQSSDRISDTLKVLLGEKKADPSQPLGIFNVGHSAETATNIAAELKLKASLIADVETGVQVSRKTLERNDNGKMSATTSSSLEGTASVSFPLNIYTRNEGPLPPGVLKKEGLTSQASGYADQKSVFNAMKESRLPQAFRTKLQSMNADLEEIARHAPRDTVDKLSKLKDQLTATLLETMQSKTLVFEGADFVKAPLTFAKDRDDLLHKALASINKPASLVENFGNGPLTIGDWISKDKPVTFEGEKAGAGWVNTIVSSIRNNSVTNKHAGSLAIVSHVHYDLDASKVERALDSYARTLSEFAGKTRSRAPDSADATDGADYRLSAKPIKIDYKDLQDVCERKSILVSDAATQVMASRVLNRIAFQEFHSMEDSSKRDSVFGGRKEGVAAGVTYRAPAGTLIAVHKDGFPAKLPFSWQMEGLSGMLMSSPKI